MPGSPGRGRPVKVAAVRRRASPDDLGEHRLQDYPKFDRPKIRGSRINDVASPLAPAIGVADPGGLRAGRETYSRPEACSMARMSRKIASTSYPHRAACWSRTARSSSMTGSVCVVFTARSPGVTRSFHHGLPGGNVLCPNDPVCAGHDAAAAYAGRLLQGAACHACLLIAETSCEQRNGRPRPGARHADGQHGGRRVRRCGAPPRPGNRESRVPPTPLHAAGRGGRRRGAAPPAPSPLSRPSTRTAPRRASGPP